MDVIDKVGEDAESSYIELHKLFNEQGFLIMLLYILD